MTEIFQDVWGWIQSLSENHNVNPVVFGSLYIGSYPPYIASIAWFIQSFRKKRGLVWPLISVLFWFIMPALYIMIFGKDVAWYVYAIIAGMLALGSFQTYRKIKSQVTEDPGVQENGEVRV